MSSASLMAACYSCQLRWLHVMCSCLAYTFHFSSGDGVGEEIPDDFFRWRTLASAILRIVCKKMSLRR